MRKITLENNNVNIEGDIPKKFKTNKVSTTLFNRYNFLILGLWYKLQSFVNIYLIFIMVLSIIPSISPIIPWTAIVPIVIIISFNLFFDWKQDYNRYKQDCKVNHEKVMVIRDGQIQQIKSEKILIGDIMILQQNQEIMADCIMIGFNSKKDCGFIETKNLDGETNLKPKYPPFDYNFQESDFLGQYTNFNSLTLELKKGEAIFIKDGCQQKSILNVENFLPRGTNLKNTKEAICIVVYVGAETKIRLNTSKRIEKRSEIEKNLDKHLQKIIAFEVLLILIIYIVSLVEKKNDHFQRNVLKDEQSFALHFFAITGGYFLLLRKFLPLPIYFIHIIIKLIQNGVFMLNKKYKDHQTNKRCKINSYNLAENLGQIQYVLMDKTGTLTQNIMKCKFFMVGNFEIDLNISENNSTLIPYPPYKKITLLSNDQSSSYNLNSQEKMNELFLLLINSCHDCYAEFKEGNDVKNDNIYFQGSSHDELALLKACKNELNFYMYHSGKNQIKIKSPEGNYNIQKLYKIPFDSDRKKMSVLIKYNGYYFLMTKGAESVLRKSSINKLSPFFEQNYQRYDELGYRTLFTGIKLISEREYQQFQQQMLQFKESGDIESIKNLENQLEENILILGATAVEDRLQEDVQETLESLRKANLKLWMITGDKTETAINIGKSTGLVQQEDDCRVIKQNDIEKILSSTYSSCSSKKNKIQQIRNQSSTSIQAQRGQEISVISGDILSSLTNDKNRLKNFGQYLSQQDVVIFSRASPNQKVEIVRILKKQKKIVLAIGDGANDVNMIQEANVGVGISGNEGKQAERSADYSVPKFKFLKPLMLIYGRKNYFRNSQLINLYFWKSFLFTMPIFYFAFFSNQSQTNTYPDVYITLQDLLFSMLIYPFKQIGEIDINTRKKGYRKNLLLEMYTYFKGQQNQYFDFRTFLKYFITACLESLFIIICLFILQANNIYYDNHSFQFDIFSVKLYTVVHFYQFFKLFFYIRNYHGFTIFFMIYLFIIYVLYTFLFNDSRILSYKNVWEKTFALGTFYVYILMLLGTLIFFSGVYFTFQNYIFPSIINRIEQSDLQISDQQLEKKLQKWREKDMKKNFKNFILRQFNLIMIQSKEQILELTQNLLNCHDSNNLKKLEELRDTMMKDTQNFTLFSFQILELETIDKKIFQYICILLNKIANKIQERCMNEGYLMGEYILKFLFGNQFYFLDKEMFCDMLSILINTYSSNFYIKEKIRTKLFQQLKDNIFTKQIDLLSMQGILFFFIAVYQSKKLLAPIYTHKNITILMIEFENNLIQPLIKKDFIYTEDNKKLALQNLLLASKLKYHFYKVYRINSFKDKVIKMSKDQQNLNYILSFLSFNIQSQQMNILIDSCQNKQDNHYLNSIKKFSLYSFQILFKLFIYEKYEKQLNDVIQLYNSIVLYNIKGIFIYYSSERFDIQSIFLNENQDIKDIIEVNLRIFYTAIKQNSFKNIIINNFKDLILKFILINLLLDDQQKDQIQDNCQQHINMVEDQINSPQDENIQSYSSKFIHLSLRQIDYSSKFLFDICAFILSKNFQFKQNFDFSINENDLKIFYKQITLEQQVIICFKVLCILLKCNQINTNDNQYLCELIQSINSKIADCEELIKIYYIFLIKEIFFYLIKNELDETLIQNILQIMIQSISSNQQIYQKQGIKFFNKIFKDNMTNKYITQDYYLLLFKNLIENLISTNDLQIFNILLIQNESIDKLFQQDQVFFQNYLMVIFQRLYREIELDLQDKKFDQDFLYQILNLLKFYSNDKILCDLHLEFFQKGIYEIIIKILNKQIDYDNEILDIVQNLVNNTNKKLFFHNEILSLLEQIQNINDGRIDNLLIFYEQVILKFEEDLTSQKILWILIKLKKGLKYIIQYKDSSIYIEEILIFAIIFIEKLYDKFEGQCIIQIYEIYNICIEQEELPQRVQKYLNIFYLQLLSKDLNKNPLLKKLNEQVDMIIKIYDKYNTNVQKRFIITYLIRIFIYLDNQILDEKQELLALKIFRFLILFIKKIEIDQISKLLYKENDKNQLIKEEKNALEIQQEINSYIKTYYKIQSSTIDNSTECDFLLQSNDDSEIDILSENSFNMSDSIELKSCNLKTNELYEFQLYFKNKSQNDAFAIENYKNSLQDMSQNFFKQILTQMVYIDNNQGLQIRRVLKVKKNNLSKTNQFYKKK